MRMEVYQQTDSRRGLLYDEFGRGSHERDRRMDRCIGRWVCRGSWGEREEQSVSMGTSVEQGGSVVKGLEDVTVTLS